MRQRDSPFVSFVRNIDLGVPERIPKSAFIVSWREKPTWVWANAYPGRFSWHGEQGERPALLGYLMTRTR